MGSAAGEIRALKQKEQCDCCMMAASSLAGAVVLSSSIKWCKRYQSRAGTDRIQRNKICKTSQRSLAHSSSHLSSHSKCSCHSKCSSQSLFSECFLIFHSIFTVWAPNQETSEDQYLGHQDGFLHSLPSGA